MTSGHGGGPLRRSSAGGGGGCCLGLGEEEDSCCCCRCRRRRADGCGRRSLPSRRRAATRGSRRAGPVGPPAGREGRRRPRQGGGGLYIHIHSVLILCQRQWYASRAGHREVRRSGVTALGGPSGSRASVGMAGGECCQRARARYHHSAERSSRRPSPRGAGGRAVRLQPLMHQWARCAGGLGRSSWAGHASRLDPAARGDGWVRAPSRGPGAARQGRAALGAERRWRGQSESRTGRRGRAGPPCHHA